MTLKGGASLACAVCKFQRRKCKSDCPLAPYFPADQPRIFHNAHRLFGVRNILKILEGLHPSQHPVAMRTIIDEANMRDWYPVHGCLGVIHGLRDQIHLLEDEIHAVYAQLDIYRRGTQMPTIGADNGLCLFQQIPPTQNLPQQQYNIGGIVGSFDIDGKDNNINMNANWFQNQFMDGSSGSNSAAIHTVVQPIQQEEVVEDYNELHPFFDTIDDRQSYMESKCVGESSSESIECVAENDLKRAAACFSLTSVN